MSAAGSDRQTAPVATQPRPRAGGGPFGGPQLPAQKAMQFGPSAKRLMGRLRPEAWPVVLVTVLAIVGVVFAVLAPKILGQGTNIIFEGFISSQLPAGTTKDQVIAGLRAQGNDQQVGLKNLPVADNAFRQRNRPPAA